MNRTHRAAIIVTTTIAVLGLAACGDDAKSPAPVGSQVTTNNTEAMMTPTTEVMMTDTTEAVMTPTTEAMMTDASTTSTGG